MNGLWNFKAVKKIILNPLPFLTEENTGCVSPQQTVEGCGEVITLTETGFIIKEIIVETPGFSAGRWFLT
jgi:hypothetical protein